MSSNKFVRLLRNSTLDATHDSALSNLQTKLAALADGEVAIASYGSDWATAKSILGVVRVKNGAQSYTIYDNEASSQEIATAIANLDATVGATSVESGKHVAVQVVETDGKLTALTVTENDIASAQALTDEIARAKEAEEANATAIANEKTRAEGAEQTNAAAITAEANRAKGAEKTNADAIAAETTRATNAETALSTKIEEVKGNAAKYEVVALSAKDAAKLGANVKEAYKVVSYTVDGEGTETEKKQVGDTIKIYKDSTLKSASFSNEILTLVYILADGTESTVNVDMKSLVSEAEIGNGIAFDTEHKLYVKLAEGSENFLTVDANGVKLSGVQNAINAEKDRALAAEKANADAIKTLNDEVIKNEKVTAASLIKIANASGVVGADDVIGYQKKDGANYIGDATSVHDATVKLDAQLKTVADSVDTLGGEALKKVNGSNAITVSEKDSNNAQTVSIKLDSVKTDNALQITGNGLYISNVWDCGEY